MKNPHAVALGKKGGQVKGKCKARTREQCQAAANARWSKHKLPITTEAALSIASLKKNNDERKMK